MLYALEAFLARLAASTHTHRLVLKGGVLLAAFDARRPTRDVDLHAQALSNDQDTVRALVGEIAAIGLDDGLLFDHENATSVVIRDEDEYSGVRVSMACALATARISFYVDVNVGDPIFPAARVVHVPRLLGGASIALQGYPISMVHAEKIVTAVSRGIANTRWRDFADVYTLSGQHAIAGEELVAAIHGVAQHRAVDLRPLRAVLAEYAVVGQSAYAGWRRRNAREGLPADLGELIAAVADFADAAVSRAAAGRQWNPLLRVWE